MSTVVQQHRRWSRTHTYTHLHTHTYTHKHKHTHTNRLRCNTTEQRMQDRHPKTGRPEKRSKAASGVRTANSICVVRSKRGSRSIPIIELRRIVGTTNRRCGGSPALYPFYECDNTNSVGWTGLGWALFSSTAVAVVLSRLSFVWGPSSLVVLHIISYFEVCVSKVSGKFQQFLFAGTGKSLSSPVSLLRGMRPGPWRH